MAEDDFDLAQLAHEARALGYSTREQVAHRLMLRIARDQSSLRRRQRRNWQTAHDQTTAEDILVTALAIEMLLDHP